MLNYIFIVVLGFWILNIRVLIKNYSTPGGRTLGSRLTHLADRSDVKLSESEWA